MRVRYPIAGAFLVVLLAAAYLGLGSVQVPQINDKILHFTTFFLLTLTFYWILDTTRRRTLNLTLLVVTVFLGTGSEAAQGIIANRQFDPLDIAANIFGSLCALGLCTMYHKRMLDRRRQAKGYGALPQDGDEDLELGDQESGVVEDGGEESADGDGRLTPSSGDLPNDEEHK